MRCGVKLMLLWTLILSVLMVGCVLAWAEKPTACTITVEPGQSIQATIDAAPEGAVICLAKGKWEETIRIRKSLILRGEGAGYSVIHGTKEDQPVVWVSAPVGEKDVHVVIDKVTVTGTWGWKTDGIVVDGSAQATITYSTIERNGRAGIYIGNSAQATIENSTIAGNRWAGIWIWHSARATITNSTIHGNQHDGIYIWCSAQATITGSTVKRNEGDGIYILDSAQAIITDSIIEGNEWDGIDIWGTARATIEDCTIKGHDDGIWIWSRGQATITNSTITGNVVGISLQNSAKATIEDNKITGNERYGVALTNEPFAGYVTGKGNTIPGPDKPDGNQEGAVYPDRLDFLIAKESE